MIAKTITGSGAYQENGNSAEDQDRIDLLILKCSMTQLKQIKQQPVSRCCMSLVGCSVRMGWQFDDTIEELGRQANHIILIFNQFIDPDEARCFHVTV
jgi:hypothetical protein